jgi:hypothetical protein
MRLPRFCKDGSVGFLNGQWHFAAALLGNVFKGQVGVLHGCA